MATKQIKAGKSPKPALVTRGGRASTEQILDMTLAEAQNSARTIVKKHSKIIHALSKL